MWVQEIKAPKFWKVTWIWQSSCTLITVASPVINTNESTTFDYPIYAILFNSTDIIYKNLLNVGYFEESIYGIDYPFINGLHYLYTDEKFIIRRSIPIANYSDAVVTSKEADNTIYNNGVISNLKGGIRLC